LRATLIFITDYISVFFMKGCLNKGEK